MQDKKISQLPNVSYTLPDTLIPVVTKTGISTYVNNAIKVSDFLGSVDVEISSSKDISTSSDVSANTVYTTNVMTDTLSIGEKSSPASNIDDSLYGLGRISFDDNYLYIKTSSGVVKRIPLNNF